MNTVTWALWAGFSCTLLQGCGSRLDAFEKSGLIDDFEDNDKHAASAFGFWYTVDDGTAPKPTITFPVPADEPGNHGVLHFNGGPYSKWGSELGVSLHDDDSPYDASDFSSLNFDARADTQSTPDVAVLFLTTHTFLYAVKLSTVWQSYSVPFNGAVYGSDPTERLDPSQLQHLQMLVTQNNAFDLWFDNVRFAHDY